MELDPKLDEWIIDFIHNELRFLPYCQEDPYFLPFAIHRPFAVYDISGMDDGQIELLYELAPRALQNCLKPGYQLYAVDYYHNTVLYDPLQPEKARMLHPELPSFTSEGLAYFLGFYPDGDYYFYLDRYGAFGYLSHPWREEVWIYGVTLMREFEKIGEKLGWRKKASVI